MDGFYWHRSATQEKNIFGGGCVCNAAEIITFQPISVLPMQVTGNNRKLLKQHKDLLQQYWPQCLSVFYTMFFPHVFIIFLAPICMNMVSYIVPYLLLILHDVAGKFKHKLILLYNCCHNNAFPGLSSTYKEKCSWMWKNWERHQGPAGQKGRIAKWIKYQCLYFSDHRCSQVLLFSKGNKPREILSWVVLPTLIALSTVEGKKLKSYN